MKIVSIQYKWQWFVARFIFYPSGYHLNILPVYPQNHLMELFWELWIHHCSLLHNLFDYVIVCCTFMPSGLVYVWNERTGTLPSFFVEPKSWLLTTNKLKRVHRRNICFAKIANVEFDYDTQYLTLILNTTPMLLWLKNLKIHAYVIVKYTVWVQLNRWIPSRLQKLESNIWNF